MQRKRGGPSPDRPSCAYRMLTGDRASLPVMPAFPGMTEAGSGPVPDYQAAGLSLL